MSSYNLILYRLSHHVRAQTIFLFVVFACQWCYFCVTVTGQICQEEFAEAWVPPEIESESIAQTVNFTVVDLPLPSEVSNDHDWSQALRDAGTELSDLVGENGYGGIRIRPGIYPFKRPFTEPRSNTVYFGGGTLKRTLATGADEVFAFGRGGNIHGPDFENITVGGLVFDMNGFIEKGAMLQWNSRRSITNIVLTNLTFIDSNCPDTVWGGDNPDTETDDWCINFGGHRAMTNVTIANCVHNLRVHQFFSGGLKGDLASADGVRLVNNVCYGSRSVAMDFLGNRLGGMLFQNILIEGNRIINPWHHAIAVGLDGANVMGMPRYVCVDGVTIRNNEIIFDELGNDYSQSGSVPGILLKAGDTDDSVFKNVVVENNQVVNVPNIDNQPSHTAKDIAGLGVSAGLGGLNAPAPEIVIRGNEMPVINLHNVDHSKILSENNIVGSNDSFEPDRPSPLSLGAYEFDGVNDIVTLKKTVSLPLNDFELSFRMYVPHLPSPNAPHYIFYFDESNFLRIQNQGELVMRADGVTKHVISANTPLSANKTYHIVLQSFDDGKIRAFVNGKLGGPSDFGEAESLTIDTIAARVRKEVSFLQGVNRFNGFIWDVCLDGQDAATSRLCFTGTTQVPDFGPWEDVVAENDGVLTPVQPFHFLLDGDYPVSTFPIRKPLDDLNIEFSLYPKDLTSKSYLFWGGPDDFIQLGVDGSLTVRLSNEEVFIQETLIRPFLMEKNRPFKVRIRDVDDSDHVVLKATVNGQENVGNSLQVPAGNGQFEFKVDRLGLDNELDGRFVGSIWDVTIEDLSDLDVANAEKYIATDRSQSQPIWNDVLGGEFPTRNHCFLTPVDLYAFDGAAEIEFEDRFEASFEGLDISFRLRVDQPTNAYLFYLDDGNYIFVDRGAFDRLKLIVRTGYMTPRIVVNQGLIEVGRVVDVRIFDDQGMLAATVNGKIGPRHDLPSSVFQFSRIARNFIGGIWDVTIRDSDNVLAAFEGSGSAPWQDTSGNEFNGQIVPGN